MPLLCRTSVSWRPAIINRVMLPWKDYRASNAPIPCSHLATPRHPISPPRRSTLFIRRIATRRKWGFRVLADDDHYLSAEKRDEEGRAAFNAMKVITVTICRIGFNRDSDFPHRFKRYAAQISTKAKSEKYGIRQK